MTPTKRVRLAWAGRGKIFQGGEVDGPEITLDGDGREGPSSTTALLLALANCMAIDIRHILGKSRVPVEGLTADVEGERAEDPPRSFTSVRMTFSVSGPTEAERSKVERAVALSRETYCSVLHTLRDDLELETEVRID